MLHQGVVQANYINNIFPVAAEKTTVFTQLAVSKRGATRRQKEDISID